jgi:mRNA-degrading endonuclease RelE of RelBE toxin-antitoxin system
MSYRIIATSDFAKELKRLARKYISLQNDFKSFLESLEKNPLQGRPLGNNCYKVRLSISSKGKGKSGGARVITYVFVKNETIYLISIYDKSEKENISSKEINERLKGLK